MGNRKRYRIESIDLLRGIVMIIMALDHVRLFFGYGSFFTNPTDLNTTTPLLFLTRWITHFCAPVFVFLAGTSAFLFSTRKNSIKEVSWFLFTRGLWLLFVEVVIINFSLTFDISFSMHRLQVIWAIGISMLFLSAIIFLPKKLILAIGIILVFGHNLFDSIIMEGTTVTDVIWYVLHQQKLLFYNNISGIYIEYPVLPWIGLMILGYRFGTLYHKEFDPGKRKKWLLWMGIGAMLLFIILRIFNLYGDPNPWSHQKSFVFSILSFLNTTKYPPSLLFLLMTIGPSLIFLSVTEHVKNRITKSIIIFGRVPLFFYMIQFYVIHLLAILGMIYAGRNWSDCILTAKTFMTESLADYGYNLVVVYIVWGSVVLILFPLCKLYNNYKTNNRTKWWLSYL